MIDFICSYYKFIPVAILAGVVIDAFVGDPMWLVHPVQIIGKLIDALEEILRKKKGGELFKGFILWLVTVVATGAVAFFISYIAYRINPYLMLAVMAVMSWQCIAAKSLCVAAMKVGRALQQGDTELARRDVSMIVGRDTAALDDKGITRAAVETVAENTNDGVICPLFFLMLGGPILGFVYKAVSTMDSMIGYKNDEYILFGRFAAKADDVFAFIPARLSAVLMIGATGLMELVRNMLLIMRLKGNEGRTEENVYSIKDAARIFARDRYNHASPNSAQCESVCAGALGLRLAGPTSYFGKLCNKPYIGDAQREIESEDIRRSCVLMYLTMFILLFCYTIVLFLLAG